MPIRPQFAQGVLKSSLVRSIALRTGSDIERPSASNEPNRIALHESLSSTTLRPRVAENACDSLAPAALAARLKR
jgi:hypothetical protein